MNQDQVRIHPDPYQQQYQTEQFSNWQERSQEQENINSQQWTDQQAQQTYVNIQSQQLGTQGQGYQQTHYQQTHLIPLLNQNYYLDPQNVNLQNTETADPIMIQQCNEEEKTNEKKQQNDCWGVCLGECLVQCCIGLILGMCR